MKPIGKELHDRLRYRLDVRLYWRLDDRLKKFLTKKEKKK